MTSLEILDASDGNLDTAIALLNLFSESVPAIEKPTPEETTREVVRSV